MKVTDYDASRYYSGTSPHTARRGSYGRDPGAFFQAGGGDRGGEATSQAMFSNGVRVHNSGKTIYSTGEKLKMDWDYDQELEDARINDPVKYKRMVEQRKQDIAKSLRQLEELAGKNTGATGGSAVHNGVTIGFDFDNMIMSVGDMSSGRIINAGRLSNGYCFQFNRENINDVVAILDLFSPEDINKIMEAITMDNMALSMGEEIEETKSSGPEMNKSALESLKDLKAFGGSDGEGGEEETTTTSEVVVAPDGSKTLVITVKIGKQELVTKVQLSPAKHEEKEFEPKINAADEKDAGWKNSLTGTETAVAAYAANFLYATNGKGD